MDELTPKQILDKSRTHSTKLSDIDINWDIEPLECGFPSVEHYEYLAKGEGRITVIAARPGNGKTALACQLALNISKKGRALYFSLEMSKSALAKRLLAVESGVAIRKLKLPINEHRLKDAQESLSTYKLEIIDKRKLTVDHLIICALDEAQREPIDAVFIDYIGLLNFGSSIRALAIGDALVKIKEELAEKLKIPVIVLAQMKRGFEERYAKAKMEYEKGQQYQKGGNDKILDIRPGMDDLAESSWLEHATDVIMFLHRPCLLNPDVSPTIFQVFVVKNRNGEAKDFMLQFSQELTRFVDPGVL